MNYAQDLRNSDLAWQVQTKLFYSVSICAVKIARNKRLYPLPHKMCVLWLTKLTRIKPSIVAVDVIILEILASYV